MGPLGGESHVTTRIMGTYGYAAPEYVATGEFFYMVSILTLYIMLKLIKRKNWENFYIRNIHVCKLLFSSHSHFLVTNSGTQSHLPR